MPISQDCVVDIGLDLTFTPPFKHGPTESRMDCDLLKDDDIFNELSNDLEMEIPDDLSRLGQKMYFGNSFFDSLVEGSVEPWPELFPSSNESHDLSRLNDEVAIKEENSSSPTSFSSSDSQDGKYSLDTPPISPPWKAPEVQPPLSDFLTSPPNPPATNNKILKINPNNIKIITCSSDVKGFKPIGKQTKVVLPKQILDKVIYLKRETEIKVVSNQSATPDVNRVPVMCNRPEPIPTLPRSKIIKLDNSSLMLPNTNRGILPCIKQETTNEIKPKDDLALKALKKQQRMIKNRESACLSRKKKKEYVTSLETKVSDLELENRKLKMDNDLLRARVKELELGHLGSGRPQIMNNLKKTTALFAVLLMVSLNIGSLGLLPFASESISNELKLSKRSIISEERYSGRALLWANFNSSEDNMLESDNAKLPPAMCPLYVNQTESRRLEKELRQWIDVEQGRYRNSTKPSRKPSARQLVLHSHPFKPLRQLKLPRRFNSAVEVYRPPFPLSLPRRDDTFYVVSFSSDHLLLPARSHNSTARPKMSFVLPTQPINESLALNGSVQMMQIDCEVLATRSFLLSDKDLKLLQPQLHTPEKEDNRNLSSSGDSKPHTYRPYFLRSDKPSTNSDFDQSFDSYVNELYQSTNSYP